MEKPSHPQNTQLHHSEARERHGNKAYASLAWGHSQTPRTACSCPLPTLAREASSLAPVELFTCFSLAQLLKTQLLNVSWSPNHRPLFMDVAKSDKISFSELVPNLITPPDQQRTLAAAGEKELESHWRQGLQLSLVSGEDETPGPLLGEEWAGAGQSPSVHPPSPSPQAGQESSLGFYKEFGRT